MPGAPTAPTTPTAPPTALTAAAALALARACISAGGKGTFLYFWRRTIPGDTVLRTPSMASFCKSAALSCGVRPTLAAAPPICSVSFCIFTRMPPNITMRLARSLSLRPAPFTTRLRRDSAMDPATSMSGNSRSCLVMDMISDLATRSDFSASCMSLSLSLLVPGSIFMREFMPPMLPIISICVRKSSKSNVALMILSRIWLACSSFTAACARSTRLTTSPMPRMRLVMRSG
mmetsp:Transcript_38361/g.95198  ORF Transcript_38361/g.95198 Transcript_38361/m.95198 type:complete len:232 (-) Transcript_38361:1014-1709(-)